MKSIVCFAASLTAIAAPTPAMAGAMDLAMNPAGNTAINRPFLFTGATVRVSLGARGGGRPEAAFRFAGATRNGADSPRIGEGIALGLTSGSKPRLTIAGVDGGQLGRRLNMSGGAQTGLILGGLVIAGLAVAFATTSKVPDDLLSGN